MTKEHLRKLDLKTLQHPPYSPDISPCDYAVFGPLKRKLRGQRFATLQALQDKARHILKEEFKTEFYEKAIFDLKKRWQTVKHNGEYLTHSRLSAALYGHHDK
jgi:histone-lysine N-methyltransferase SETMAR